MKKRKGKRIRLKKKGKINQKIEIKGVNKRNEKKAIINAREKYAGMCPREIKKYHKMNPKMMTL